MKLEHVGKTNIIHYGKDNERTAIHHDLSKLFEHAVKNGEQFEHIDITELPVGSDIVIAHED